MEKKLVLELVVPRVVQNIGIKYQNFLALLSADGTVFFGMQTVSIWRQHVCRSKVAQCLQWYRVYRQRCPTFESWSCFSLNSTMSNFTQPTHQMRQKRWRHYSLKMLGLYSPTFPSSLTISLVVYSWPIPFPPSAFQVENTCLFACSAAPVPVVFFQSLL